jgi:FkbM family methyltransferase
MKVIDSFTFFNEFDMLKFRLNYLNDVVDHFIISESNYTHSGKPKPYYLDEVWNNIPENIKTKIIRLKYEPNLSQISLPENVTECDFQNGNWKLEREQRDLITYNLSQFSPYDLFMVSDVDEIPNKKVVETFKNCDLDDTFCCVAKCEMFYYNFATYSDNNWAGTVFSTIKTTQEKGCDHLRNQRFVLFPIDNGGWHFSYFGDVEKIKNKLNSFAHQEYNKDRYKNDQNILDAIQNKKDLLQRGKDFIDYNFYNFPEDLRILITNIFPKQFYEMNQTMQNGSGATETSYLYLQEHYTFPENVFVSHLPEEIKKSNHQYKILWAHHAYDQPVFVNFDHNTVNHIVSPSRWNKDQLVKFLNVPEYKISVIPNGVAEMFQYSNQKTKTMIFTSIPYKGLEVLSKVIPLISHVHKDVKFKIFSSMSLYGPSNDQFIELYEYLKTLPNVEYSSAIDREELVKHYQESAFFIHPNIWEETFGVSMIEAMKCGAYPIITDIGALAEVAGERNATVVPIEGENTSKGWKVTDNFICQFADACCLALEYYDNKPKFYQEVSKLISDYVTEKYDWKKIAEQWKELVTTLCGNTLIFRENTADKWIYDEVYTKNVYNIGEFDENDVIIDIGSHCGYFGKLCLDSGSKKVFLYEAEESNYNILIQNLSQYEGWKAHNVAVWKEQTDDLDFYTYPEYQNTGLNSVFKSPHITSSNIKKIKSITLDSILQNFDEVKLLKIDAEGSEYDILMNSKDIQKVKTIVGEYHNDLTDKTLSDLVKFLENNKFTIDRVIEFNDTSGVFFASQKSDVPVYYCMLSTQNTEEYTDVAIETFFKNTTLKEKDKFFLIDNDGTYSLKHNQDQITIISNAQPRTFSENMNFIMKLCLIDGVDFFGLSNDVVFTENWNQNFNSRNKVLVPLCNQHFAGEFKGLKIETAMDLRDYLGKESELNEFAKDVSSQEIQINSNIIGFYCFYIPNEVIAKVGFLDENFKNGGEDIDYRLRASQFGVNTEINTSSYLLHFCGKSTWRSGESHKVIRKRYQDYKTYFEKKWGKELSEQLLVKCDY